MGPHRSDRISSTRILAFSLGHPGRSPGAISAELARPKWGGIEISEHGVRRLALIARHADPYEHKPEIPTKELHIDP